MLELMNRNENKTMTSLEVAEITGKKHKNIIRDIKDETDKLGVEIGRHIFEPSYYINSQNKKQPMFELTLDGVMELVKSYTYLDTNGNSHMCLKWTEKGRKFIYELLKELGYIYEEE